MKRTMILKKWDRYDVAGHIIAIIILIIASWLHHRN